MRWVRDYSPQPEIGRLYRNAMIVTVSGNVILAVSKALIAWVSGSVAVYADAANSISDVIYSFLIMFGLWAALRPPDLSHPQGHSRFEPLVGLMVTLSMGIAGYEAARAAIERFFSGAVAIEPGWPSAVLLFSAVVKVGMFLYIREIAKRIISPTLATTAKDHISDVLTSTGAFLGALGSYYLHPLLDPIAGILVAAWIFRSVITAGKENLDFLTGAGAPPEIRQKVVQLVSAVAGVQQVHHTMIEYVGPRLVVDLHINVNGKMTLDEAHDISDEIIQRLEDLPEIDRAYVHVEPEGFD